MSEDLRLNDTASTIEPQFVDGPGGELLLTCVRPRHLPDPHRAVLCLPPFAEELNKSRRMLALLGQRLAAGGALFLLPDLLGTGDSAGDFPDADADAWVRDVRFSIDWLRKREVQEIQFVALRFGSLLLGPALEQSGQDFHRIVLWNPVISGTTLLNQFIRTKLAAGMKSGAKSSVAELRKQISTDGSMEIAGYFLTRSMMLSIDSLDMSHLELPRSTHLLWTETGPVADGAPNPKSDRILSQWRDSGIDTTYTRLKGQPFWMTPEINEVEALLDVTAEFLGAGG